MGTEGTQAQGKRMTRRDFLLKGSLAAAALVAVSTPLRNRLGERWCRTRAAPPLPRSGLHVPAPLGPARAGLATLAQPPGPLVELPRRGCYSREAENPPVPSRSRGKVSNCLESQAVCGFQAV